MGATGSIELWGGTLIGRTIGLWCSLIRTVLLGLWLIFGFAVCILLWKLNERRILFFGLSMAPQGTPFVRRSGHCIAVVGVLGAIMSPVVVRSLLLDIVALRKPKSTNMVGGVANVLGKRLM
jgi:hypothetical protein